ncbi:MAG: hypothetical protein KDB06_15625 [Ilumatobacter sp.]|nr:hypothetical protein [Ilumatobacter sp.]
MIRAILLVGLLGVGFATFALAGVVGWGIVALVRRLLGHHPRTDARAILIAAACGFAGGWVGLLALFTADAIHDGIADGPASPACWIVAAGAGAASTILTGTGRRQRVDRR